MKQGRSPAGPRAGWRNAGAAFGQWDLDKVRALLQYAGRRAREDQLMQVAGSLTFTTVLSLVPVLTVAFALFSAFPIFQTFRQALEGFLFANLIPGNVSNSITGYLGEFSRNAKGLTAAGLGSLLVTAVLTLLTVENAFNAIWRVKRARPLAQRILVFWAVLSFGPVLMGASLSVSSYLISISAGYVNGMTIGLGILLAMLPVLLSALAFALLYVAVPNTLVMWRDALVAGLVAAIAFELTKRAFGAYITQFPAYTAVYGTFAALPIFLLWIYLSWLVTLLGATIAANLPVIREGHWQRRVFAGSEFYDALGVLLLLYQARHASPRSIGELDLGRKLRVEADYLATLLTRLKSMHLVGKLQQEGRQAHWALLCDPYTMTLRTLYERLVLNLPRLHRTALAQHLKAPEALAGLLDNAALDTPLGEIFEMARDAHGNDAQAGGVPKASTPADAGPGAESVPPGEGQKPSPRLEVVPPGWHGQV